MPRIHNKKIKKILNDIFQKDCCLYKKIITWLMETQCCNNIYFVEDKVYVVAFKDNLVVCSEFDSNPALQ